MIPTTAPRPPLVAHAIPSEDSALTERWRQWQVANALTSQKNARWARLAFIALFVGLIVILGLQLLAPLPRP